MDIQFSINKYSTSEQIEDSFTMNEDENEAYGGLEISTSYTQEIKQLLEQEVEMKEESTIRSVKKKISRVFSNCLKEKWSFLGKALKLEHSSSSRYRERRKTS